MRPVPNFASYLNHNTCLPATVLVLVGIFLAKFSFTSFSDHDAISVSIDLDHCSGHERV